MAITNTNTDEQVVLSSDIYDISAFIDQIRKQNIESADETSSMVGIFGYLNEIFSNSIQNALIVASQTSNEAMPTRAKFIKNVVAHAMSLGITDIYAKPASMVMMFYLPISYVEQNFVVYNELGSSKFIIDKNIPINIEGFEYHFDYDILLTKTRQILLMLSIIYIIGAVFLLIFTSSSRKIITFISLLLDLILVHNLNYYREEKLFGIIKTVAYIIVLIWL